MDVEQMHAAASEEYKNNYSTGEYCHEQSFLWGFQEGVELAESNSGKELLYVAQKTAERTKKELKIKAREWLEDNKDNYNNLFAFFHPSLLIQIHAVFLRSNLLILKNSFVLTLLISPLCYFIGTLHS